MPRIKLKSKNPATETPETLSEDIPLSDISVARLIDDGLNILYREVRNLSKLSVHGKLQPADARDLRDTIKLLFEIQAREKESLRGLTDEQLEAQVKAALEANGKDENGPTS